MLLLKVELHHFAKFPQNISTQPYSRGLNQWIADNILVRRLNGFQDISKHHWSRKCYVDWVACRLSEQKVRNNCICLLVSFHWATLKNLERGYFGRRLNTMHCRRLLQTYAFLVEPPTFFWRHPLTGYRQCLSSSKYQFAVCNRASTFSLIQLLRNAVTVKHMLAAVERRLLLYLFLTDDTFGLLFFEAPFQTSNASFAHFSA